MPKQHPVGFGWQPKAVTKFSDSIPRTLEITLTRNFVGTMEEAIHLIEEDVEYIEDLTDGDVLPYIPTDTVIDDWDTDLIWKELTKYGD